MTRDGAVGRYHIQTYGCQMNEHDSEVLAGILEDIGYERADDAAGADLILVNTCCVRDSAEQRILGELGRLKRHKYRDPEVMIGVSGCMVMKDDSMEELRRRASHVDFVLGTDQLHRLPEFLERARQGEGILLERESGEGVLPTDLPRRRAAGIRAWVPIIYGCDNFCTYCIVPYVRGREISRPVRDIIREVEVLVDRGVREITLLGQNVNSYGRDLEEDVDFGDLLCRLNEVDDLRWIRYTTSHPRDFSPELVDRIAGLDRVCEHFHLPVQSGSDRILRRMGRGYTRQRYLELTSQIREVSPGASVTTDVIVGFPGETEEDFEDTCDLFRRVRFDGAFSFLYSPRSGTAAAEYPEQVPLEIRRERLDRLNRLQYGISLERNRELEGAEMTVLIDGPSEKHPEVLRGRSRTNKLVLAPGPETYRDRFVRVRIVRAETFQLRGEIIGPA
ncbi:MAG: tRNA (N6-isopentenyl adenosine(37)-C2)-methylthiotransferase MiaB [Bacillota bacterium]